MSNTKFTSGPWKLSYVGKICIGVQNGGSYGQMICNTILPDSDEDYKKEESEIIANAKLIAASPDMLHALDLLIASETYDQLNVAKNMAVKAIKKATD